MSKVQAESQEATALAQTLKEDLFSALGQVQEAQDASATLAALYSATKEELSKERTVASAEREKMELESAALRTDCLRTTCLATETAAELERTKAAAAELAVALAAAESTTEARSREVEALNESLQGERSAHARSTAGLTDRAAEQEHRLREELQRLSEDLLQLGLRYETVERGRLEERERSKGLESSLVAETAARADAEKQATSLTDTLSRTEAEAAQDRSVAGQELAELREQIAELRDRSVAERVALEMRAEKAEIEAGSMRSVIAELEGRLSEEQLGRRRDVAALEHEAGRQAAIIDAQEAEMAALRVSIEETSRLLEQAESLLLSSTGDVQAAHHQVRGEELGLNFIRDSWCGGSSLTPNAPACKCSLPRQERTRSSRKCVLLSSKIRLAVYSGTLSSTST